jgi:hypothetical protein
LLTVLYHAVLCCAVPCRGVQAGVAPLRAMQDKAYGMLSARAYVHQYEAHGLSCADISQCFAVVEDVLAAYAAM